MASFTLDSDAAALADQLSAAASAFGQLDPVNAEAASLFPVAQEAGRAVRADASHNGLTVTAAWKSPDHTVVRPWFVAQLNANQTNLIDLYLAHAAAVVAEIGT